MLWIEVDCRGLIQPFEVPEVRGTNGFPPPPEAQSAFDQRVYERRTRIPTFS